MVRESYKRPVEKYDDMFIAIYNKKLLHSMKILVNSEKKLAKGFSPMTVMIEYASKKPLEFIMIIRGFTDRSFSPQLLKRLFQLKN